MVRANQEGSTFAGFESSGGVGEPASSSAADGEAATNEKSAPASPQKKKKHKAPIIVGVVAAIVVVAGIGFWTWHEQPSFCNAICHSPMDPYVEGYYHDTQQMAYAHQVEGTTCLQCHEAKLDEQVAEAISWVSGDFTTDEQGYLTTVGVRADQAMCATPNCHNISEVVAATENWGGQQGVNPHDSHQGYALDCSSCHTAHGQSYMYCNTCHDYEVPEGWAEPTSSAPASLTEQIKEAQ